MQEALDRGLVSATAVLRERLTDPRVKPPAGAVAALVAAWAAALAAAAADRSRSNWDGAAGACAQATALRTRALRLLERGVHAHAQAMETLAERGVHAHAQAMETLAERGGGEDARDARENSRDWRLGESVKQAAEPPLELAACALSIAQLASTIAADAAGEVRADAAVAARLAAAVARAGAHLVDINLIVGGDREPARHARALAEQAELAAAQASGCN
jgi:formiminotetrahydrofolate cyclodeaminase